MIDNKKITIGIVIIIVVLVVAFFTLKPQADEKDPIKIGGLLYLTGPIAAFGEFTQNAINIAVDEVNSTGGVRGREIEVLIQDHAYDPKRTVPIYQFFNTQGVEFYFMDGIAAANVPPLIRENNHFSIVPSVLYPSYYDNNPLTCRLALTARSYGPEIIKYISEKYPNPKVGILVMNNEYGVSLEDELKIALEKIGGSAVVTEKYDQTSGDFRTQITKLKSRESEMDVLVAVNIANTVEPMFEQMIEQDIKVPIVTDNWTAVNPELRNKSLVEGVTYIDYEYQPELQHNDSEKTRNFKIEYKKRHGVDPSPHAANGYDAITLLARAMNEAEELTPESVSNYLINDLGEYEGVGGPMKFTSDCEVERPIHVRTIKNGETITIR